MTLNELRESVKAGNGIRGADALAAEQVRFVDVAAGYDDIAVDVQIAQAQLMSTVWIIEKQLRDKGFNEDSFQAIAEPMENAALTARGPIYISTPPEPARTPDEWNAALSIAWKGIDAAKTAGGLW